MDLSDGFRKALLRRLISVVGAASIAAPALSGTACGGKVEIDRPRGNGGNGAGGQGFGGDNPGEGGSGNCALTSTGVSGGQQQVTECIPIQADGCPSKYDATMFIVPSIECAYIVSIDCGPVQQGPQCCYLVTEEDGSCGAGRPMIVNDQAIAAPAHASDGGWTEGDVAPQVAGLDAASRAALAEAWTRDALLEHASIASFSRFSMELLAVGAPAELVAAAHRAALDEVRHAKLCFALAEAYRGAPATPGPFPFDGTLSIETDLARVAAATAREGCIGETLAALVAAEELARAKDPAVKRALSAIADDEARHAELAWRTVAWALERGGHEVRDAVAAVFDNAARHLPSASALPEGLSRGAASEHGRLDREAMRTTLIRAISEVVLPCARALLERSAPVPLAEEATPCTQRSPQHGLEPLAGLRARG